MPSFANPLNPDTFVHKIHVPVFLACQWTDEQTGGHCPELAEHFTGTRLKWFTFTNGAHIDSLDPATAVRWYDFLSLFVAHRLPDLTPGLRALAPELYQLAMGIPGVQFPADPIEDEPDYASALAAFEAEPQVRILFDNGAGSSTPGAPVAGFEQSFSSFPIPGTSAESWYLGAAWNAGGDPARNARRRRVHVVSQSQTSDRFHRQHRSRRFVGHDPELPLDPEPSRHRSVVHHGAATEQHGRDRRRRAPRVDRSLHARRRSASHDLRGSSRRQRDVRAERLAATRASASSTLRRAHCSSRC